MPYESLADLRSRHANLVQQCENAQARGDLDEAIIYARGACQIAKQIAIKTMDAGFHNQVKPSKMH